MAWQEPYVLDAERCRRGDLLVFADGRHLLAVAVVEPSLLTMGAYQDRDAEPGVDPAGDRPGCPELTVVRMCRHDEHPRNVLVGPRRGRLAEGPLRHAISLVRSPRRCPWTGALPRPVDREPIRPSAARRWSCRSQSTRS